MKNHLSREQRLGYLIKLISNNMSRINEGSLTLIFQDACLIQINKKEITKLNDQFLSIKENGVRK